MCVLYFIDGNLERVFVVIVFMYPTCSMTKFDIKNYFQSIYKINVALVNTRIQQGVFVVVIVIIVVVNVVTIVVVVVYLFTCACDAMVIMVSLYTVGD